MSALYRIYRPQKFAEVVGQKHIVKTLQNAAQSGLFAHAYLFCGSRGVGKTSLARIIAKAANCEQLKDGDVCLTCASCVAIAQGNFLDLVEVDAASNTGVDNVRDLIEQVRFQPSRGKYKVFIIDEVHMLSKGAFNALLKTLEEPPSHVIFVLATTEIHKVPATIVSRTQRFILGRLSFTEVLEHIVAVSKKEKFKIDDEVLVLVARQADGSLRDALSLLSKIASLGGVITLADAMQLLGTTSAAQSETLVDLISRRDPSALPGFFESLLEQGVDFVIFNRDFLEYLRKLLVVAAGGSLEKSALSNDELERISKQAGLDSVQGWMRVIRLFLRSLKDAQLSPVAELPMLLASIEATASAGGSNSNGLPAIPQAGESKTKPTTSLEAEVSKVMPAVTQLPETEPVVPVSAGVLDDVSSAAVELFWPRVIDAVRQKNSPLATLLRNSPLDSVSEGVITLRVKYLFHKEHLENLKNHTLITEVIASVSGKQLRVKARVTKPESEAKDVVDMVTDALQVFGGELVE